MGRDPKLSRGHAHRRRPGALRRLGPRGRPGLCRGARRRALRLRPLGGCAARRPADEPDSRDVRRGLRAKGVGRALPARRAGAAADAEAAFRLDVLVGRCLRQPRPVQLFGRQLAPRLPRAPPQGPRQAGHGHAVGRLGRGRHGFADGGPGQEALGGVAHAALLQRARPRGHADGPLDGPAVLLRHAVQHGSLFRPGEQGRQDGGGALL
mmetsp:Transcript_1830/g.6677  ORF Transcript_1830/g.6677 Transcript_1830/m.6677 type:complete len:209 (+) Transcript_1830:1049-1675(+)